MIDLWQSLCHRVVGTTVEVMVANRREYHFFGIDTVRGEDNTATPQVWKGNVVLMLLLDSVKKLDLIIVTHELGHWVLKMQGLKSISDRNDPNSHTECLLNSLASHSALYVLQRSLGHEPQKVIDKRAAFNIGLLSSSIEPVDEKLQIQNALVYADDLINCSESNRIGMQRVLNKKHPNTEKKVNKILEITRRRDITKIDQTLPFSQEIVQKLDLGKNWSESDEVGHLKEQTAKLKMS
jgi:hypothetical protein